MELESDVQQIEHRLFLVQIFVRTIQVSQQTKWTELRPSNQLDSHYLYLMSEMSMTKIEFLHTHRYKLLDTDD